MAYRDRFVSWIPELILASQSPARRGLLESLGCIVHVQPTYSDESHPGTSGLTVVQELAERKMAAFLAGNPKPSLPVLTADTVVSCDGRLLGKAASQEDARQQISLLSGRTHSVLSGFALYLPRGSDGSQRLFSGGDEARITFHPLSDLEIAAYIAQEDWIGAAGSYRIQGEAKRFIKDISGDYCTVVGLPIQAISAILSSPTSL